MTPPTPGPWHAEQDYQSAERIATKGTHTIRNTEGVFVATVPSENAPLMTAAPKLLEALHRMVNQCRLAGVHLVAEKLAVAAIAEAEGSQP